MSTRGCSNGDVIHLPHSSQGLYGCTKLKWYFAIPNQKFKQWPDMAWRPYKSRAYHFIECNFHQVCFIPIFGMILQLGQDGPKIQLSLWVCDSFSWLWTFSLVMKHFLSKMLFDYHFPPINLFLNLFDKISNFVLSDSSEPRNLLLWINHFSVTCDSLKVGLIARQQLTDLTQVLADWFFTPCVKIPSPNL